MASDPLDTFMTWMRVEQGRSRNTLSAYKLDLTSYVAWLTTQNTTIFTVTVQHLERFVGYLRTTGRAPKSILSEWRQSRLSRQFFDPPH